MTTSMESRRDKKKTRYQWKDVEQSWIQLIWNTYNSTCNTGWNDRSTRFWYALHKTNVWEFYGSLRNNIRHASDSILHEIWMNISMIYITYVGLFVESWRKLPWSHIYVVIARLRNEFILLCVCSEMMRQK